MRRLACLVVCAVAIAPATAAPFEKSGIADWTKVPPPTAEPVFAPPVARRLALANGMALLVIENHKLPIIAMALVVPGAGAASDPSGQGGLAAFTADLLDEGAGGMSALAIADEQDRLGAVIRAFAGTDAALISVRALRKTLDPTIDLFTKLVTRPAFDDKELERVRGDRVTALELRRDRPREVASIMLNAALYGGASPYGHPAAGYRDEFKAITGADVRAFYATHYRPAAMTLVVSGDVDPAALHARLDAGLGAWRPAVTKPLAPALATPQKLGQRLLVADRPGAAQSDVRIGLIGPARKDKRYYAFEVMRTVLGDGFTSRLTQRLREQLGITYGAGATMDWRLLPGPFVIGSAIVTAETAKGVAETFKLVDDLASTDVPAAELDKSKQYIIRALPSGFETNAVTAQAFVDLVLHGLPDDYYATYADEIRKVTAADVKAAARALLPSSKMIVAFVGDLTKLRAELDKLKLGARLLYDLYGRPAK